MLIAKCLKIVFLKFMPISLPRGEGICTLFLTLQQLMSNFFVLVMPISLQDLDQDLDQVNSTIAAIGRPCAPFSTILKHSDILVVIALTRLPPSCD